MMMRVSDSELQAIIEREECWLARRNALRPQTQYRDEARPKPDPYLKQLHYSDHERTPSHRW
jgi:hypothetical protein